MENGENNSNLIEMFSIIVECYTKIYLSVLLYLDIDGKCKCGTLNNTPMCGRKEYKVITDHSV